MSELRLALFEGCLVGVAFGDPVFAVPTDFTERGLFGWLADDLTLPKDGFAGDLIEAGDGLPCDVPVNGLKPALWELCVVFVVGVCVCVLFAFAVGVACGFAALSA